LGQGGLPAIVAAHELVHALDRVPTNPPRPNACPGDPAHVCDNPADLMEPRPSFTSLAREVLDSGHDDYSGHAGSWWDVRCTPGRDAPKSGTGRYAALVKVVLSTRGPGIVGGNLGCARRCSFDEPPRRQLTLHAQPFKGAHFVQWQGSCRGAKRTCTVVARKAKTVNAVFER